MDNEEPSDEDKHNDEAEEEENEEEDFNYQNHGWVVRTTDVKSVGPGFRSRSDR